MSPSGSRSSGAFSLLELCLTVVLLAVLASTSIGRMTDVLPATQLVTDVQRLQAEVQRARHQSALLRQPHRVVFHRAGERYEVVRLAGASQTTIATVKLSPGTDLVSTTLASDTAEFTVDGILTAGGEVRLQSGTSIKLATLTTDSGLVVTK